MTAITFPTTPTVGDRHSGYEWNGTGWMRAPLVGLPTVAVVDNDAVLQVRAWWQRGSKVTTGEHAPADASGDVLDWYFGWGVD